MAVEGGGDGAGPAGAAELKAAPERIDPAAHPRWLKPLGSYDRHERREFQVTRFS